MKGNEEEAEIMAAVQDLVRLSEDKIKRQAYQRRLDEMATYNGIMADLEDYRLQVEKDRVAIEHERAAKEKYALRAEESTRRAQKAELALVNLLIKTNTIPEIARQLNLPAEEVKKLLLGDK